MTARPGPGGRIQPDNRGRQTPGVGANSKRHDLERRDVPTLAGSDLQQGDVEALRQGLRTAPVQTQQAATPSGPAPAGRRVQEAPGGGAPEVSELLRGRLGNSMGGATPLAQPDPAAQNRAQTWVGLLTQVAKQPGASPLLRTRVQTTLRDQIAQGASRARGGVARLAEVDEALEAFGNGSIR